MVQKKVFTLALVAGLGALAGTAQAEVGLVNTPQTDLSLYGILDVGVAQMTNAGNFSNFVTGAVPTGNGNAARVGTVRGMMNGGESQSRWGIKGSEDMGNGNKAFFQLESAFSLGNGAIATSGLAGGNGATNRNMIADTALNGQLFNRMAFIGIANNDLGALTFGRQYSLQLDIIGSVGGGYDPVNAQMFSPINFSGAYGGGGATDNSRVDNAIKYAKKFGNFNVNALYGMGGVATATSARSNAQVNVGYEADTFGVQAAMQQANDTTSLSAGPVGTVGATFENLKSYMLVGRYQVLDALSLKAGFEREQINAPHNYGTDSLLTTIYSYNIGTNSAYASGQKNINVFWLGANYQISPAVKASVGFYQAKTDAVSPAPGVIATGANDGATDKYYSAMVEYNLSKKTNLYAAMMLDKKSGGIVWTATGGGPGAITSFNTYGVGVRVKF
jgi:predicted porin